LTVLVQGVRGAQQYRIGVHGCVREVVNKFTHSIEETPNTPQAQITRMAFGEEREA
jgi:hypothetical protein